MVQVSAWVVFIVGIIVGMLIGSIGIIILALTYKDREAKNGSKKEK